ncbi:hypothetical protein ACFVIM_20225, partial [Streptomyces sp. NPDC057638]
MRKPVNETDPAGEPSGPATGADGSAPPRRAAESDAERTAAMPVLDMPGAEPAGATPANDWFAPRRSSGTNGAGMSVPQGAPPGGGAPDAGGNAPSAGLPYFSDAAPAAPGTVPGAAPSAPPGSTADTRRTPTGRAPDPY